MYAYTIQGGKNVFNNTRRERHVAILKHCRGVLWFVVEHNSVKKFEKLTVAITSAVFPFASKMFVY